MSLTKPLPPNGSFANRLYNNLKTDRYGRWSEVFTDDMLLDLCERMESEAHAFYRPQDTPIFDLNARLREAFTEKLRP